MRITYDKEADAVYIYLLSGNKNKPEIVSETKGEWPIHIDFSKEGKLVGIEILQASQIVNIDNLKKLKFQRIDTLKKK